MNLIKKILTAGCATVLALTIALPSTAQLNPFGAIYFQNQYLINPSMAGLDKGLVANLGFRQQWSSVPGAPQMQALTAEYGSGKKVGVGLNLTNDKSGILGRTRVMGTYAYHLPLSNDDQHINFGISAGFMDERIDNADVNGDQTDVSLGRYNDRKTYVDADFGTSYTSNTFNAQLALPNLKQLFNKDDSNLGVDRATFMAAISYKIAIKDMAGFSVEPKVALRGIKDYQSIFDAGANAIFANNSASVLAMYHSTGSATFGAGMNFKNTFSVLGLYSTSTSDLSNYSNGNFEVALRFNVLK